MTFKWNLIADAIRYVKSVVSIGGSRIKIQYQTDFSNLKGAVVQENTGDSPQPAVHGRSESVTPSALIFRT